MFVFEHGSAATVSAVCNNNQQQHTQTAATNALFFLRWRGSNWIQQNYCHVAEAAAQQKHTYTRNTHKLDRCAACD